jgi:GTPase Era involved in 16S rRNA processing
VSNSPTCWPKAISPPKIEALLGTPVYLDLWVKVVKEWQRDSKQLNRLGF